nr:hypothetical protein BgiMline_010480 [Biomphalaria glabrata]
MERKREKIELNEIGAFSHVQKIGFDQGPKIEYERLLSQESLCGDYQKVRSPGDSDSGLRIGHSTLGFYSGWSIDQGVISTWLYRPSSGSHG